MIPKNSKNKTEEITKNFPINIVNIINKEPKKERTSINKADGVDNKIEKKVKILQMKNFLQMQKKM